jgi:protease IV
MFSRRHPYLFFLLCMASLFAGAMVLISVIMALGMKGASLSRLVELGGERVGIVEVSGVISESDEILDNISRFRDDETIKAIILRINSPGGGVAASQEIFREISKTVKTKKVVASMGSVAASGGYYIAAAADKIVASPGTITGSIGVIMGYTTFEELLKKIGLAPVVVKSGKYKDIGSPVRDMTPEERGILQEFTDQIHRQFIQAIIDGRKIERSVLESVADGRILSGERAKDLGLVDELGNFEDAVGIAGQLAGIKGKLIKVYPPEKRFSFIQHLTEKSLSSIRNLLMNQEIAAGYVLE